MKRPKPLPAESLCWRCDPERLDFETTDELDEFPEGSLEDP